VNHKIASATTVSWKNSHCRIWFGFGHSEGFRGWRPGNAVVRQIQIKL